MKGVNSSRAGANLLHGKKGLVASIANADSVAFGLRSASS